ncbi:tetratricopeptide repeat protein [Pseudochryseolinea flava]|uniref:MalT-like TPR region domain-containing protein n=1 Tax=Pseudochryseolinea flava TaxID=2059302 RepID=A0A364Y3Y2_9BACT|nr:tetratricopeptide repeat protein [Pseudochryseolinea flava]RAW01660.1 hypothetical protein DQQ10_08375 [Pseudochryseolinea flava]
MRIFVFLMVCFSVLSCSPKGQAQNSKIDSLKSIYAESKKQRAEIDYNLAYEYVDFDLGKALIHSSRAKHFYQSAHDTINLIRSGVLEALVLRRMERMDSSLSIINSVVPLARRLEQWVELCKLLRGKSLIFLYRDNHELALKYSFEALEIAENISDTSQQCVLLNNIGLSFFRLGAVDRAIQYYEKALSLYPKPNEITLLTNASHAYSQKGNFEVSLRLVKLAKSISESSFEVLEAFGTHYHHKRSLDSAAYYYLRAYHVSETSGRTRNQAVLAMLLADINMDLENIDLARHYLSLADTALSHESFNAERLYMYRRYIRLFKTIRDNRMVERFQRRYIDLRDSLTNGDALDKVIQEEIEFNQRKNLSKIKNQSSVIEAKEVMIMNRNRLISFLILTFVLLIIIIYLLRRQFLFKRRINILLDRQVRDRTMEIERVYNLQRANLVELREQNVRQTKSDREFVSRIEGVAQLADRSETVAECREYVRVMKNIVNQHHKIPDKE